MHIQCVFQLPLCAEGSPQHSAKIRNIIAVSMHATCRHASGNFVRRSWLAAQHRNIHAAKTAWVSARCNKHRRPNRFKVYVTRGHREPRQTVKRLSDGSEGSYIEKHTAWPAAVTGRQDVIYAMSRLVSSMCPAAHLLLEVSAAHCNGFSSCTGTAAASFTGKACRVTPDVPGTLSITYFMNARRLLYTTLPTVGTSTAKLIAQSSSNS